MSLLHRVGISKVIAGSLLLATLTANLSAQPRTTIVPDGKVHKFEARDKQFFIDGQPTLLMAGEMHFGRVQAEDWETRIKQAKAMGLNAISFYLFWNQVEKKEGQFEFTGMNDVRKVIQLCQANGMWVVLRPGPYCCAEVEYGGIPYWTLKYPNVKIRTDDPRYLDWCRKYLAAVYKQVGDLQVEKGGPILLVQIDNEIGITDPPNNNFMAALHKIFQEVGFTGQLFTCDPTHAPEWADPAFRLPGVIMCRNGLANDTMYGVSAAAIGNYPVFVPEMYTAWFKGWSEGFTQKYNDNASIPKIVSWSNYLLDHNYSFTLFMFFGGTTYGFFNGSNFLLPVQTSYDYSAAIDEAGRTTEKYRALRDLYGKRFNLTLPAPPPEPLVITLPAIRFTQKTPLLATLPVAPSLTAAKPVSMENLDQDYGFVLYRKQFPNGIKGTLELKDAMDYTTVMVNGKTVAKAFRGYGLDTNKIALNETGPVTLDLLVYSLGRISVVTSDRTQHLARKGLVAATLDGTEVLGWEMYSLPYASGPDNFSPSTAPQTGPAFYRATFNVDRVGGTFLDMRNWSFGAVWVNGHNLGRFWDVGGQRSLFLPANWLKQGQNEIVVLELHDAPQTPEIAGVLNNIEGPAKAFAVKLDEMPK